MRDADRFSGSESGRTRMGGVLCGVGLLAVLVLGLAAFLLPLKTWLLQAQAIKAELDGFGLAAPLIFVLGSAALTAAGAPRLVLCSLAGMAFGISRGLVWSQLGTLLGAYGTFLMVRSCGRESILRRYPKLDRFSDRLRNRGLLAVLLIRQLPMNGFYNNLLLGLSPVSHGDFLAGSLLGYLPLGVTAVLIGAGVVQGDRTRIVQYYALGAIAAFVLLGFLLHRLVNAARATADKLKDQTVPANDGLD